MCKFRLSVGVIITLLHVQIPFASGDLSIDQKIREGNRKGGFTELDVRLVDGISKQEGRVEIQYNGKWGTICDDGFSSKAAEVVCHILGYQRLGATPYKKAVYGKGKGPIWLDELKCHGNETSLGDCQHLPWGFNDCRHTEDAGVKCQGKVAEKKDERNRMLTLELDMVVEEEERHKVFLRNTANHKNAAKYLWKKDISYKFGDGIDDKAKHLIRDALDEWEAYSCLDFSRDVFYNDDYNKIVFTSNQGDKGCASTYVGMKQGSQEIHLGKECLYRDIILHEIGHALGFYHEHTRADRDRYIKVHRKNIAKGYKYQFKKMKKGFYEDFGKPYDYKSIMHYGRLFFSNDESQNLTTMETLDPEFQDVIGKAKHPSFLDYKILNAMYECTAECGDVQCPAGGFLGKHCRCYCEGNQDNEPITLCFKEKKCPKPSINLFLFDVLDKINETVIDMTRDSYPDNTVFNVFSTNLNCSIVSELLCENGKWKGQMPDCPVELGIELTDGSDDNGIIEVSLNEKRGFICDDNWDDNDATVACRMMGFEFGKARVVKNSKVNESLPILLDELKCSGYESTLSECNHNGWGKHDCEHSEVAAIKCFSRRDTKQIHVFSNYDCETDRINAENDIALLKIDSDSGADFNDYVQPACLPGENVSIDYGMKCEVSGWGKRTESGVTSNILRSVEVPIVDDMKCKKLYEKYSIDTQRVFCAGDVKGGTDTCKGDSGGPLVCDIKDRNTVIGITSWGKGCGRPNAPGIYTNVSSFVSWIKQQISLHDFVGAISQGSRRQPQCEQGSCYPATGDLLIGREGYLTTNSTCGMNRRERYCVVSHLDDDKKCFLCDSRQPWSQQYSDSHRIENIVSIFRERKFKWWQAETGVQHAYIQLDLEAEFHFKHLIMTFKTFRPKAMYLERSFDFGNSWNIYQYFAYDCARSFPGVPTGPVRKLSDVICESRYSDVVPSTEGEVIFRVLPPFIRLSDPYSQDVQDLLKLTNLRVVFTELHTLSDIVFDGRQGIKEKYYYAMYDMTVRGSCSCYGHASRCIPVEGYGSNSNMVNGQCECTHNTKGLNCEQCLDFYNDAPWRPARTSEPNACKKCECYNHATSCHFDVGVWELTGRDSNGTYWSGGVCDDCLHNTMGRNCQKCRPFFYQDPNRDIRDPEVCQACDCDPTGSMYDGECENRDDVEFGLEAGRCICKTYVAGRRCDQCQEGYWNLLDDNPDGCEGAISQGSRRQPQCEQGSCYPATGDLLIGREGYLTTNSTCGMNRRERYCIVSHLDDGKKCFLCDSRQPWSQQYSDSHRIENIVSSFRERKFKWWQAENGVQHAYIQLDLEVEFYLTHLIMTFKTFRPKAMYLERSFDFGYSWNVYRYFAYDCARSFPGVPTGPVRKLSDVICESRYSDVVPSTDGEVIFRVLPPFIRLSDPYSQDVQDLLKLTNLRVVFTELHTLSDIVFDGRQDIKEKYYYAMYDMTMRGRCSCYGHASRCIPVEGYGSNPNMVNGQCVCTHNTKGLNCEQCLDFYNDAPWRPARTSKPNACKKCECYNHATSCHFDVGVWELTGRDSNGTYRSGGVCDDCLHNTMGRNCQNCRPFFYQDPNRDIRDPEVCQACDCDPTGSMYDGECENRDDVEIGLEAGRCICKTYVAGRRCDQCQEGYWNLLDDNPDGCEYCDCDSTGSLSFDCDPVGGQCQCKPHAVGRRCDQCAPGTFGFGLYGCTPCNCHPIESRDNFCDIETGQCLCIIPNVHRRFCDICEPGFYEFAYCRACGCNGNADICDNLTGECDCKDNSTGHNCERCADGYYDDPRIGYRVPCKPCMCPGGPDHPA